jgi:membrane-bound acyltransferase YfiQ involved in biofilm formation
MSFLIYLAGFAILIGGVAWGLIAAGVPQLYVLIASVILLGVGILTGVTLTRQKDVSN